MRILAIETSCDETAAAVVEDGRRVLSNVIASQMRVHGAYYGVVPELASRCHIEYILPVIQLALDLARETLCGEDETRNAKLETRNLEIRTEARTTNSKPETRNSKPETRNPKPETRNPKPETRNPLALDAIAVTRGPGLIGSLLVGVETAKTLAWVWNLPLIPVHHIAGHLQSVFCELPPGQSRLLEIPPEGDDSEPEWRIENEELRMENREFRIQNSEVRSQESGDRSQESGDRRQKSEVPKLETRNSKPETRNPEPETRNPKPHFDYPYLGLVISGGHSSLVRVDAPGRMRVLGSALDDAPGEAYDKVAKRLGLAYPGGPAVDNLAAEGDPKAFDLPRPVLHARNYDFSFSGLKTAVVRAIEDFGGLARLRESETALRDLCASFQAAVIDVLLAKSERALKREHLSRLAIVGGVACNRGLRAEAARRFGRVHLVFPPPILCTDNAAMIGAAAHHTPPLSRAEALALDARAGWELP